MSFSIDGNNVRFFRCTKEVKQGDPLSPLLFCLAENVLCHKILLLIDRGKLQDIFGSSTIVTPSHHFFMDDIMVFYKGHKKHLENLMLFEVGN